MRSFRAGGHKSGKSEATVVQKWGEWQPNENTSLRTRKYRSKCLRRIWLIKINNISLSPFACEGNSVQDAQVPRSRPRKATHPATEADPNSVHFHVNPSWQCGTTMHPIPPPPCFITHSVRFLLRQQRSLSILMLTPLLAS